MFLVGFFVFGPQMLIGMAAAELSHKKAAGAATGFVGWVAYLGAAVEIDFNTGVIQDLTTGESFQGQAFPEFMQKIIAAEGLINYINSQE
jgi:sugar phosphate permease